MTEIESGKSKYKKGVPENYLEHKKVGEGFRGSLGFDFIFVESIDEKGNKIRKPVLVEINGYNSGFGMRKMPKGMVERDRQMFANLRGYSRLTQEEADAEYKLYEKKRDKYNQEVNLFNQARPNLSSEEIMERKAMLFFLREEAYQQYTYARVGNAKHAYPNPLYFSVVCDNKDDSIIIMTNVDHPRLFEEDEKAFKGTDFYNKMFAVNSSSGKWIVKPSKGAYGDDIEIFDDHQFDDVDFKRKYIMDLIMKRYHEIYGDKYSWTDLVVEEFLPAMGAESLKDTELASRPASLRLIFDFVVDDLGEVHVAYCDGFQRVSNISDPSASNYPIVNSSKGALTAKATDEEISAVVPVAKQVFKDLFENYVKFVNEEIRSDENNSYNTFDIIKVVGD